MCKMKKSKFCKKYFHFNNKTYKNIKSNKKLMKIK